MTSQWRVGRAVGVVLVDIQIILEFLKRRLKLSPARKPQSRRATARDFCLRPPASLPRQVGCQSIESSTSLPAFGDREEQSTLGFRYIIDIRRRRSRTQGSYCNSLSFETRFSPFASLLRPGVCETRVLQLRDPHSRQPSRHNKRSTSTSRTLLTSFSRLSRQRWRPPPTSFYPF